MSYKLTMVFKIKSLYLGEYALTYTYTMQESFIVKGMGNINKKRILFYFTKFSCLLNQSFILQFRTSIINNHGNAGFICYMH